MKVMRDLLLRVQHDSAFAQQVRDDLDSAAMEYALTEQEMDSLRRLDRSLIRYLVPAHRLRDGLAGPEQEIVAVQPEQPWTIDPPPWTQAHPPDPWQLDPPDEEPPNEEPGVLPDSPSRAEIADTARRRSVLQTINSSTGAERRRAIEELLEGLR